MVAVNNLELALFKFLHDQQLRGVIALPDVLLELYKVWAVLGLFVSDLESLSERQEVSVESWTRKTEQDTYLNHGRQGNPDDSAFVAQDEFT